MYPLQGPPSEDEPVSYKYYRETHSGKGEIWWLVGTVIGAGAAIFVTRKLVFQDEDSIELHILHFMIRGLQESARKLGQWAIELEKEYNELAESLH